jgi:hypothetical protein
MSTPAPAPSAAAMVYLFAHQVVESGGIAQKFPVPCTDTSVKQAALAGHLFAIGFWSLQNKGKLDLTMGKRTMLGVGRQQITASIPPGVEVRTPPAAPQMVVDLSQLQQAGGLAELVQGLAQHVPAPTGGPLEPGETPFTLEDATLHQVQLNEGTAPIRDVVRSWFSAREADPDRTVIDRVARELNELGYATGMDEGSTWSNPRITVDCERRAALEMTATEVLERWRAFIEEPDGLGSTLLERCSAAISSAQSNE